jgi:hypothetical protein
MVHRLRRDFQVGTTGRRHPELLFQALEPVKKIVVPIDDLRGAPR